MQLEQDDLQKIARRVLALESEAIQQLAASIGADFAAACKLILDCRGRVIVTGMGKSGHIGQKIAASLTSTGTAAHFLHPAEGVHGDLGVVHRGDLLLAISNSGETGEILSLLGPVNHVGIPVIAMTQQRNSTLGQAAAVVLELGELEEADNNNLVPTTSTTVTLALGDALTVALMEARGFTPSDFAVFHPQGMLGKRLTLVVEDLLRGEETNPVITQDSTLGNALEEITSYKLGAVSVIDETGTLCGVITDGDVRRIILRFMARDAKIGEVMQTPVAEIMTISPCRINDHALAYDALKLMENHEPRPIMVLPVVDARDKPVGMLHLHALVQAGFKSSKLNAT